MTIRTRFALASFALVGTVLAATGVLQVWLEKRNLERAQARDQQSTIQRFARVCEEGLIGGNDLAILNYAKELMQFSQIRYVILADLAGKALFHSDMLQGRLDVMGRVLSGQDAQRALSAQGMFSQALEEGNLRTLEWVLPVFSYGKKTAVARIGYDKGVLEESIRKILEEIYRRFLIVAAACLGLGLLGASILAGALNRPIRALMQGVQKLGSGDKAYRIPLKGKDELGLLAAEFNSMVGKLAELDELKEHFMENITHDLRSPLAAIQGYSELMLSGMAGNLTEEQGQHIQTIYKSSQRLASFVNDILDLSKLEAGKMELDVQPVELSEAVDSVEELLKVSAGQYRIGLEKKIEPQLPKVLADAEQLNRVITNLVSNAIKFTPQGGRIVLWARRGAGRFVEMAVEDTGVGIPAERLREVFSKFFQVAETKGAVRKVQGTGLGLTIAKEIVEAHGGRIWVESKLHQGTTFRFTLPAAA